MSDIYKFLDWAISLKKKIDSEILKTPGQMNLLDIANSSELENLHSDILAFLLKPDSEHHHPEYGKIFLKEIILPKCKSLQSTNVINIFREKGTDKARRIDLLVETESDLIIIENKINAADQKNQLTDYLKWSEIFYKDKYKNIIVLYLTLEGKEPSKNSLSLKKREELKNQNRYANISYKDDILSWLNMMTFRDKEKELESAITQLIDSIKYNCGLKIRSDKKMQENMFASELYEKYKNYDRGELIDIIDSMQLLYEQIPFIVIVQFLSDLKKNISRSGDYKVYYTHHQNRFSDKEKWINAIKGDFQCAGIEVPLEKPSADPYGLAVEFSTLRRNTIATYGIMSHGNSDQKIKPYSPTIESKWEGELNFKSNTDWWECETQNNWFYLVLFRTGGIELINWEKKNNKTLSEYVTGWFIDMLPF